MKKLFVFSAIVAALFFGLSVESADAAVQSGDLIKLVSDGDVNTQHDAAVYYVAADGRRYVFPNDKTYFTWYENFDSIREVTDAELASLMIGGNVTYRSGTRLVKITSDPTVYAVEPSGVLRAISSEAVAQALYGDSWNQIIDDVSDAYFVNYTMGSPIGAPVFPTGAVVHQTIGDSYFYIENGTKRRIVSELVRQQLRIQSRFIITTEDNLSGYPEGNPIETDEQRLMDVSGRNSIPTNAPPRFTVRTPSTTFFAVGSNATLLELHITSGTSVTLTRLVADLKALTDESRSAGETDDDDGGLIFRNNAQKNFIGISFVDQSGAEVMGRQEIALDLNQDQQQTLTFNGTVNITAGVEKVLYLKAQINSLLPNNEAYQVTLPISGITLRGSDGAAATFLPTSDLVGPSLSSLADSLKVEIASLYSNKEYVKGARNVPINGFKLLATTYAPNVVKTITFQGYIDEGDSGGLLPGSDADNGTETLVRDMFTSQGLYLRDSEGILLAGPATIDLNGVVIFSGLNIYIQAGQSKDIVLHGDISRAVNLEGSPNIVAFDIEDAVVDIVVTDEKGDVVSASGKNPNRGVVAQTRLTVREQGLMDMGWYGNSGDQLVGREVKLGELRFDPDHDDYVLETVAFRQTSSTATSLGDLRLEYQNETGETVSKKAQMIGGHVVFSNVNAWLPRDVQTTILLFGDIFSRSGGAVYGELIGVDLNSQGPLVFSSASTEEQFEATDLNLPQYTLKENRASAIVVRYSKLYAEKLATSPSGDVPLDSEVPVLQFQLRADAAGPVRIRKMSFKLTPGDVGIAGSDNDSLELWADLNGDTADDDSLVNLKRTIVGTSPQLFGEDSSVNVRYMIVSGGVRDTTPAGRDSVFQDYGIVEYDINEGSEIFIPANGVVIYTLELQTASMAQDRNYSLGVELLSESNFLWTDIPTGYYTPLTGSSAEGVSGLKSSLNVR